MADSYSAILNFTKPALGVDGWPTKLNADMDLLDAGIAGAPGISIAGLTTYTLSNNNGSTDDERSCLWNFTGAISANCTVTIPSTKRFFRALNSTSGGYSVILTTGGGTTATISNAGALALCYCDGTNVTALSLYMPNLYCATISTTGDISCGGNFTIPNNYNIQIKDSGGTARQVLTLGPGNNTILSNGSSSGKLIFQNSSGTSYAQMGDGGLFSLAGIDTAPITNKVIGVLASPSGNPALECCSSYSGGASLSVGVTASNVYLQLFYCNGSNIVGSITTNGSTTAFNTSSDRRLKTIYGPYVPGNIIDQTNVYLASWKSDAANTQIPMVIADEIQALAPFAVLGQPNAVKPDGSPSYQQLDALSLLPIALAELKALRARVASLEAKIQ